jgi:uncharacterized membrane protein
MEPALSLAPSALEASPCPPSSPIDLFRAVITPHRPLSLLHYLLLVTLTLTLTLAIQVPFVRAGAWPSALFGIAEAALLLTAVLLHRLGQAREETIVVGAGNVQITRRRRGRIHDAWRFPVYGLQVVRVDDPDYGCLAVYVEARGRRHEVARDLSPDERPAFARALAEALGEAGGSACPRIVTRPALLEHLSSGEAR